MKTKLLILIAAIVGFCACHDDPMLSSSSQSERQKPLEECASSDNDLIRLRMAPACASCHGEGASRPLFASLAAFEDLMVYNERFVIAGDPDNSELVRLLEGTGTGAYTQMPTVGDTFAQMGESGATDLSMEEVRDWVETLTPPTRPAGPDVNAISTRRLTAQEFVKAMQVTLGYPVSGGADPLIPLVGTPPLAPDGADIVPFYLNPGRIQVFGMLGGENYLEQQPPEKAWSSSSLLAVTQLAQGVCYRAVQDGNPNIFEFATTGTTLPGGEAEIRQNIEAMYVRFLQTEPKPADIDMLFSQIFEPVSADSVAAWTQVCASLFRDPMFISY